MKHNLIYDLLGFAVAGGLLAYRAYTRRDAVVKRELKKVPRARLGTAVPGSVVKHVGRLDCAAEPLVAPLSGRRCVYYELTIEEARSNGRSRQWVTIVEQAKGQDFVVGDGKVAALVRTRAAQVAVHKDEQDGTSLLQAPNPELAALLLQHGQEATNLFGLNRRLRFQEGVLEAGEHVAVCGAVMPFTESPSQAAIDAAGGRPIKWLFDHQIESPLYVSDDPAALFKPQGS